jgi:hypothetical protein
MISSTAASELANAPLGSIELGGQSYFVSCPTKQDMTSILLECKKLAGQRRSARVLELFREFQDYNLAKQMAADEDPEPANSNEAQAMALLREMGSLSGCLFAAGLILRRGNPDLTMARLRELITADNCAAVGSDLLESSGMVKIDPNSTGASGSPSKPAGGTQPSTESSPNVTSAPLTHSP